MGTESRVWLGSPLSMVGTPRDRPLGQSRSRLVLVIKKNDLVRKDCVVGEEFIHSSVETVGQGHPRWVLYCS